MTIGEKIINNCKKGLITIIQDDTENYMAFSNHKDYDGLTAEEAEDFSQYL